MGVFLWVLYVDANPLDTLTSETILKLITANFVPGNFEVTMWVFNSRD